MTQPTFRTIGTRKPSDTMDKLGKLLWLGMEIELDIVDVPVRQKLAAARAMYFAIFEEHGGQLGPCPWAKGAPKSVGTANPGIA